MFFAFCWHDKLPIVTFNSSPKKESKKKSTYKRFTYPYPHEEFPQKNQEKQDINDAVYFHKYALGISNTLIAGTSTRHMLLLIRIPKRNKTINIIYKPCFVNIKQRVVVISL